MKHITARAGHYARGFVGRYAAVAFVVALQWPHSGIIAATTLTDLQLLGPANSIEANAELTVKAGGTLRAVSGSVVDLFHSTLALPNNLSVSSLNLDGSGNRLLEGATFTLANGSTFTAASGSTLDLTAATVAFPSAVILTTGAQTLSGKTLLSPVFSNASAGASTDMLLSGGSNGARLKLGQGPTGDLVLSPSGDGYVRQTLPFDDSHTLWSLDLSATDSGDWRMTYEKSANNVGARPNRVFALGYNYAPGGAPVLSGEPAMAWIIETFYKPDSSAGYVEGHLQYTPTSWGQGFIRPLSTKILRGPTVPASTTYTSISGDQVSIVDTSNKALLTVTEHGIFAENGSILVQNTNNIGALFGKKADGNLRELLKLDANDVLQLGGGNAVNSAATISSGTSFSSPTFTSTEGPVTITTPGKNSNILLFDAPGNGQVVINGLADLRMNQSGHQMVMRLAGGGGIFQVGNVGGSNPAVFRFGAGGATGSSTYYENDSSGNHVWYGSSGVESARLRTNLLIGGTSDIAGSGGLKVFGTAASTSTATGALQVVGGAGIGGSVYIGGRLVLPGGGSGSGGIAMDAAQSFFAANANQLTYDQGGTGDAFLSLRGGATNNIGIKAGSSSGGTQGGFLVWNDTNGAEHLQLGVGPSEVARASGAGISTGNFTVKYTTASVSPNTGALQVMGGTGVAGSLNVGGASTFNGNVAVSGTGSFAGALSVNATTDSTSIDTGALVVLGGVAIQKKMTLGEDLLLRPTSSIADNIRLSATSISNTPGIWFRDGGAPTATNVSLAGTANTTILNAPAGGSASLRVGDTPYVTVAPSAVTLSSVPLRVTSSTASISTTTGSATFAGGIGVAGRTTTKTLSVGGGSAVDLILTALTTLDFPSIAPNGGVQDLTVSVPGASLADAVNVVEAAGAFAPAGLVLRGIVTAANTVTVRATNATTAAIDPASLPFRVTVTSF